MLIVLLGSRTARAASGAGVTIVASLASRLPEANHQLPVANATVAAEQTGPPVCGRFGRSEYFSFGP